MKTYAGYYKKEIREKSSSGAIFCAIALKILGKVALFMVYVCQKITIRQILNV